MADSWDDRAVADSDGNDHDMPGTGRTTSTLTENDRNPQNTTFTEVYDFGEENQTPPSAPFFVAPSAKELLNPAEAQGTRRRAADREILEPGRAPAAAPPSSDDIRPRRTWSRGTKAAATVGGLIVALCAVGGVALATMPDDVEEFASFLPSSAPQSGAADSPATSVATTTPASLAASCVPAIGDRIFTTDAAGGRGSAQQVIAELNYAYYVLRNGAAVAALYDPVLKMNPVAIQAAIDTTPMGTTHCVSVTPGAFPGVSAVELTESRPGEPPTVIQQTIETKDAGGTYMITAVKQ